jgi:outer membrane protein OmpA-like peptidoglycan-associated protein
MKNRIEKAVCLIFIFSVCFCLSNSYCEQKLMSVNATIYFEPKTMDIGLTGQRALDEILNNFKDKNIESIILTGYSDNIGSKRHNYTMSQKRAKAVFNYLKEKGIKNENLYIIIPKGGIEYIADNDSPENRAINRQVQVKVNYYDNVIEQPIEARKNPTAQ